MKIMRVLVSLGDFEEEKLIGKYIKWDRQSIAVCFGRRRGREDWVFKSWIEFREDVV